MFIRSLLSKLDEYGSGFCLPYIPAIFLFLKPFTKFLSQYSFSGIQCAERQIKYFPFACLNPKLIAFPGKNFLIFNPDTFWYQNHVDEINKMQNFYFLKKLNNILLVSKKNLSFDKNLLGDFTLNKNLLEKMDKNDFIYIGCQILNKDLFKNYKLNNFPISVIWNELLKKNELNGFQSFNKFYHLTNLETFRKLQDL